VHTEIQQKKSKKQASKQLKYIKAFILRPLTCDLTLRKSPSTPFVFKESLKKKPTISMNKPINF
jgi:ribosome-binding factor A